MRPYNNVAQGFHRHAERRDKILRQRKFSRPKADIQARVREHEADILDEIADDASLMDEWEEEHDGVAPVSLCDDGSWYDDQDDWEPEPLYRRAPCTSCAFTHWDAVRGKGGN
jgi:hypothetical protein